MSGTQRRRPQICPLSRMHSSFCLSACALPIGQKPGPQPEATPLADRRRQPHAATAHAHDLPGRRAEHAVSVRQPERCGAERAGGHRRWTDRHDQLRVPTGHPAEAAIAGGRRRADRAGRRQGRSKIVDADGKLTALAAGTRVRPSSCRADDCVITYDGVSPLQMDQMIVTFHLRSDVTWSDGTPLTADDSVYAYQMAADTDTPGSKVLVDHTQTYEAADASTTQWWGIPGYLDPSFMTNFWAPAPKHIWSQFKAAELPQIDVASRSPTGWGPYRSRNGSRAITLR